MIAWDISQVGTMGRRVRDLEHSAMGSSADLKRSSKVQPGARLTLVAYCHVPSRLDQMVHFQTYNSPREAPPKGLAVKVNLRSEIGRFGLIVRVGGNWCMGALHCSACQSLNTTFLPQDLQAMQSFAQTMEERARNAENLVRDLQASINTMHNTQHERHGAAAGAGGASEGGAPGGGAQGGVSPGGGVQAELGARQVEALEAALHQARPPPPTLEATQGQILSQFPTDAIAGRKHLNGS